MPKKVKKKAPPKKMAIKKTAGTAKKQVKKKPAPKKPVPKKPAPPKAAKKPVKKVAGKKAPAAKKPEKKIAAKKPELKKKAAVKPAPEETAEMRQLMLKRYLVQKREDIVKEAHAEISKYIRGENRQLVETALDDGDWSVIDLSEDVNLRKLDTHRQNLQRIDEALRKLREGTYGTCEDCGDPINAERLRILPFAIYCRDCQEKREQLEAAERELSPSQG